MAEGIDANRAPAPVSLILVSHSYPPVLGGSEIEAQRVCAALIRRGHRVTVLCAGGAPMPDVADWLDPAGVPVRIFARRTRGRLQHYAFALAVAWTLLKERRNHQLVYFLMQGVHLATGLPVARWLGKAIVMKVSGSSIVTLMRRSWLGRLELRWLQAWAYRVMVLNEGMAEEARAAGPDRKRGGEVVHRMPRAILILLADGPSRGSLEERAGQLGLSASVRFAGNQPAAGIPGWLQAGDLFALVSSVEGFSCSLVEAMSAGVASVVSDIPANTQLIDSGVHGLPVPA